MLNSKFTTMKNLLKTILILCVSFGVTAKLHAQAKREQQRTYQVREAGRATMAQNLSLTDEQKSKMQALKLNLQKEMLPIKNKIGENEASIRSLSTLDNVDLKAVNKIIDDNGLLKADIAKLFMANRQEVRKMLSDDQRIIFDTQKFQKRRLTGQRSKMRKMEGQKRQMHKREEGKR